MITTTVENPDYSGNKMSNFDTIIQSPVSVLMTIKTWYQRSKDRSRFTRLNDHLLNDIGLTHEDAFNEVDKPFWKE